MDASPPPRPPRRLPDAVAPLTHVRFRLYLSGFFLSNIGRWVELTGAVWLASELTRSPVLLGVLGLARAIPAIALSPIAGVVADRVDQRRLLQITQTASLVAALAMGLLVISGAAELWHLYLQVAIQSAIFAFDAGVRQALFPRLVPGSLLTGAVTLHATAGRSAKLIGPSLGGLAIAGLGTGAPFLLNAASYVPLLIAAHQLRGLETRGAMPGSTFRIELREGFAHLASAPVLRGLLQLELVSALLSVSPVIITIIGRQVLDVGPEGLGGLLSAPALGSLVGVAIVLFAGHPRRQGRFVLVASLVNAALYVPFAIGTQYAVAVVALIAIGLTDSLIGVTRQNIAHLAAPQRMRGRVMSNLGVVTRGASPLSEAQAGALAGAVGGPGAVLIAAAALAVATTFTAATNRALWRFERTTAAALGPAVDPTD